MRDTRARTAQRTQILDIEIFQEILIDNRIDIAGGSGGTPWRRSAVDQHVQRAELPDRVGDHLINLTAIANITRQRDDLSPGIRGDFGRRLLQAIGIPRGYRQIHALARKRKRNGFAYAAAAANDYACSIVEP